MNNKILSNVDFIYEDGESYRFNLYVASNGVKCNLKVYKFTTITFKIFRKQFTYRYYKCLPGRKSSFLSNYASNSLYYIENDCDSIIKEYKKSLITDITRIAKQFEKFDGYFKVSEDKKKIYNRTDAISKIVD